MADTEAIKLALFVVITKRVLYIKIKFKANIDKKNYCLLSIV